MTYICECGKEFDKPNSFNGHKSHCKVHLEKTGRLELRKNVDLLNKKKISITLLNKSENRKLQERENWISEKHTCEKCGKIMTEKYGSGRFCSRQCANSREKSIATKCKTSETLLTSAKKKEASNRKHIASKDKYLENPILCPICGQVIPYELRYRRRTCSKDCLKEWLSICGRKSVTCQETVRRSKNEILFYNLCNNFFNNVSNNSAIFDGWDADIIIHDYKIAVLWNGIWHYKKITRQHSVEQVQNRDNIKIHKIIEEGYIPYIIKDMGQYNESFVNEEFNKLLDYIHARFESLMAHHKL